MAPDVKTPSAFVPAMPLVAPQESQPLVLVTAKPKVLASQPGPLVQVADIAQHDRKLSDTLRAKLDFSEVVDGGSRVSPADAYGVLTPHEYERFEIIRAGVLARDRAQAASSMILRCTAGGLALTLGALAVFTSVPADMQLLAGVIGSAVTMLVAGIAAAETASGGKARFDNVANEIRALPSPGQVEALADVERPADAA